MKKSLFTTLACLLLVQLFAQTEKGKLIMGANSNAGFSIQSRDGVEDNTVNFSLGTQVGIFVIDDLAAGLNFGFSRSGQGDITSSSFTVGPFARYYFDDIFFGASFSYVTTSFDNPVGESTSNGSQYGLQLGYAAFLNNYVAIEPSINYVGTGGDFGGLTSFALNIGFTLYLSR